MTLGFLMIILTTLESGQLSAAFVNTQTLRECEERAATVRSILDSGGIAVERLVCRASRAQFEPFVHGMDDDAERLAYLISFDDEAAAVEPVASCDAVTERGEGAYCATSTQALLPQPE